MAIGAACASVGFIVGATTLTGLGLKFASAVIELASGGGIHSWNGFRNSVGTYVGRPPIGCPSSIPVIAYPVDGAVSVELDPVLAADFMEPDGSDSMGWMQWRILRGVIALLLVIAAAIVVSSALVRCWIFKKET